MLQVAAKEGDEGEEEVQDDPSMQVKRKGAPKEARKDPKKKREMSTQEQFKMPGC